MALSSFSVSAKGLDGIPYRVDVNGGGTAVTGDGQFLVIEGGEEQDRGLDPVWPKRLRLFMREDVDLSPLFGEADRAVDVAVQNVTGGTDTLVYRGFMVTDFYSDAPFEPKPLIELQALDGLGTLENDSLSAIYSGGTEVSVKSAITSILFTLYPLEVEVGTEWYPDAGGSLGASDNPLENVKFATDNYRGERPDGDAFQSQLAVLRDLCIEQGLVVKQVERPGGARWLVAQRSAYNSDGTLKVWTYDTTGSLKSGEPSTRDRSLTLDVSGQDLLREHTREFVRRRQAVEVTHDHTPLDDFVGDGGFEDAGDGNTTPWSIGSTSKLSAQVVSHDGPDNTPSASQQNTYLLEISGSPDGGNNFPQGSFEFPVSQSLGEVTGAQPRTAGRIKQSFEGNKTALTPKDEDGIAIRVSIGSYWLGVRSSSLTTDVKRGTGSLYCDPLDRPIPEGAALAVIKPNPPEDQPGNEFRGTITLSERAESGDTELVGDLSADFNTPMKVLYPSIESSQSVFPIQRFVDNPRTYPRFEIVFPFEDPSGNPLEGEITYEVGGIDLILEETGQGGTKSYSADSVYLDDVEFVLTRGGQDITQTVVEASVTELGEEEAQTARTFSGPTDQNLARLRGVGFEATNWGIGVGGGSLSLAELKARERLRYWRNHSEMYSVTGVDRDGTTQLTGDELVTLDSQTYTVHSIKYDAAKGETELTLIEYEDRGTSGITLETVLEQSEGAAGSTSGGGGAVGGGGGVSTWDDLTGELSGPVPFDATDDDGNPTSRSLQFLNVTPQVDVTSDPANGIALEIKDQTNGTRLGTLTTDGRWETRADMEAFADGSFGSGSSTNSLLQVEDGQGDVLTTDAASVQFIGSGVSITEPNPDEIVVDVSGGSGSDIDIEQNQTPVVGGATGLSFEGSGIDSVDNDGDGTATVNISKGSSTEIQEGGTAQVSDATVLDFVGGDFSVANPTSGEAEVSLQNDTVTVAGNSVSLGNSTAINHGDLSSIGSSDHHTRPSAGDGLSDSSNTFSVNESQVDHDSLNQYVANEHVDHSAVTISAGTALSGGGDLTASRTLNVAGPFTGIPFKNSGDSLEWQADANNDLILQNTADAQTLLKVDQDTGTVFAAGDVVAFGLSGGGGTGSTSGLQADAPLTLDTTTDPDTIGLSVGSGLTVTNGTLKADGSVGVSSVFGRTGDVTASSGDYSASQISGFDEKAQDAVGTIMTGSGAATVTYDDAGNIITISATDTNTQLSDSEVQTAINNDADHGSTASHNYTTSSSGLTDVSADSVSDAHHAVFEPADYTPGSDVSKSDVGLANVPNVNPRSEMRNLGLQNQEMDDSWVGGQNGGQVGYDASVGLFLDYGSAGSGVSKDVYPVLDAGNTKTGGNVNVTYDGIDTRPKISLSQGSGSGLDADTLDGVEGGNYARTDQQEYFSNIGVLRSPSSGFAARFRGDNNGNRGGINVYQPSVAAGSIPDLPFGAPALELERGTGRNQSGTIIKFGHSTNNFYYGANADYMKVWDDNQNSIWTLTQGGSLGIGTTSPDAKLDVKGEIRIRTSASGIAATHLNFNDNGENYLSGDTYFRDGQVGIGTSSPSYSLEVSGDARASGEVEAFLGSDRRLKKHLNPLDSALDKVGALTGYGFDWRGGDAVQPHKRGEKDVGLIAQEVEDVLPEAVKTFTDGHSEGYKSVSYDKLVPLLVEAIKDLRSQVHNLQ